MVVEIGGELVCKAGVKKSVSGHGSSFFGKALKYQ